MQEISFKQKTLNNLFESAKKYFYLLNKEIIIKLEKKKEFKIFVIRFYKSNFLHLTGVSTKLSSIKFFENAYSKTIEMGDFECNTSKWLKELVKKKMRHLVNIDEFFNSDLLVQENFHKGKVDCLIATTDGKCTIGFVLSQGFLRPKTLMNKNKLDYKKPIYKVKPIIKITQK